MRKLKSILSLVLAFCLLMSTVIVAFAAETQAASTVEHLVTIETNKVHYHITNPDPQNPGSLETGTVGGYSTHAVEDGKTLTDAQITVWHDAAHLPYFLGWHIVDNGTPVTNTNGTPYFTTAEIHSYPITADTQFLPQWQGKYTTLSWISVHGNGGTFERTITDSVNTEVRQTGYDSFPHENVNMTLYGSGIDKITDPVCNGKTFEGWVVYYHGPDKNAFDQPNENGKVYTTAEILTYNNTPTGYTDFIAKWVGEPIDPNNCPIDPTNTVISSTNAYQISVHTNGVQFMHQTPETTGNIGEEFGTVLKDNTSFEDANISIWHEDEHLPHFMGWELSQWDDNKNDWVTDSTKLYTTAELLKHKVTTKTKFVAQWKTYESYFITDRGSFDYTIGDMGISGTATPNNGAVIPLVYFQTPTEINAYIDDASADGETFYGWDRYYPDPIGLAENKKVTFNGIDFYYADSVRAGRYNEELLCFMPNCNVLYIANWTGEGSWTTPDGSTTQGERVYLGIRGNGTGFTIYEDNDSLYVGEDDNFEFESDIEKGVSFSDFGVIIDLDTLDNFLGWQISTLVNGEMSVLLDSNGDPVILDEAAIHDFIFTEPTMIEALWGNAEEGEPGEPAPAEIHLDANCGEFTVTYADGNTVRETATGWGMEIGETLAMVTGSAKFSDPVYWDGKRQFLGWEIWGEITVTDEAGNEWTEWGPIDGKLYTTEQVVNYPAVEGYTHFVAKWAGDDKDYMTGVEINAVGGEITITFDYNSSDAWTDTAEGWYDYLKQNGTKVSAQSNITFSDPVRTGYTFEGWLRWDNCDTTNQYDINTTKLYTTKEILEMTVPVDEVRFLAKWKEIPMIYYLYGDPYNPEDMYSYNILYMTANGGNLIPIEKYKDDKEPTNFLEEYKGILNAWSYAGNESDKSKTFAEENKANGWDILSIDAEREGYTLTGWTTYVVESVLYAGVELDHVVSVSDPGYTVYKGGVYAEENFADYIIVKNQQIYSTSLTPMDAVNLKGDKSYIMVANWKSNETTANVQVSENTEETLTQELDALVSNIANIDATKADAPISAETKAKIETALSAGHTIGAELVATVIKETDIPKAEVEAIQQKAETQLGTGAVIAHYLDISVLINNLTTGETLGNMTALEKPITVSVLVPEDLRADNREYFIVHYHGDKAEIIEGKYDAATGMFTIETDKFSTYALAYVDKTAETTPAPSEEPTATPAPTEKPSSNVPATGDESNIALLAAMLTLAAAGAYIAFRKFRKA